MEKRKDAHSSILAERIPMDRGAWWATDHGIVESDTTERLSLQHIKVDIPSNHLMMILANELHLNRG